VPLKSIGNTETGPEEVEEDPMVMVRTQEQQQWATTKEQRKSGASRFFLHLFWH
jgi:hypothetical protein